MFQRFVHNVVLSHSSTVGPFGEREFTANRRSNELCVSSGHADWMIVVCHSNLGDTLILTSCSVPVPEKWLEHDHSPTAGTCLYRHREAGRGHASDLCLVGAFPAEVTGTSDQ